MSNVHIFLPEPQAVSRLLSSLCGGSVAVDKAAAPWAFSGAEPASLATYKTDTGFIAACALIDIPVGASIGAVLTRIPLDEVDSAVRSKELSPFMFENLMEIMNICSSLFNANASTHVSLGTMIAVPPTVPENFQQIINDPAGRVDFEIGIPGYKSGKVSFVAAKPPAA